MIFDFEICFLICFFFPLSTQFATFFCFLLLATGTKRSATTSLRIYWWRILHIQSLCYFVVQFSARREIQIALNALNGNKWTPTPTTRVTCGHLHSPNKQTTGNGATESKTIYGFEWSLHGFHRKNAHNFLFIYSDTAIVVFHQYFFCFGSVCSSQRHGKTSMSI